MAGQRFTFQNMKMSAGIVASGAPRSRRRVLLFYFTIFAVAFCISLLYHAMRPIMRLGGMVAAGGPYAIAHPAPGWVWVIPVSILLGMACLFLNMFSSDPDGVNLMPLAWPGLFLSSGWNFLEFTFNPPGGGIAWGWLVCGVLFVLMGGLPLLLALRPAREKIRARLQKGEGFRPFASQWLLVAAGIVAAIFFFRSVVG